MSHIYIHIPFCRRSCSYCDFHFSIDLTRKGDVVDSICNEINYRYNELKNKELKTIYFGGGTPSLLQEKDLKKIFNTISSHFKIENNCEITLEVNPEDISQQKISVWQEIDINRISLGVQSFLQKEIQFLGRNHNQQQVESSIDLIQKNNFKNISIDLIYGLPISSIKDWQSNLKNFFELKIPHLSCYGLTLEKGTKLFYLSSKKYFSEEKIEMRTEEDFYYLYSEMENHNYLGYEVSNFAKKEDFFSRHNLCYWQGREYLGIGPSAHSFDGEKVRTINISKNQTYISSLNSSLKKHHIKDNLENNIFKREKLSEIECYHDYLISRFRSIWGCNLVEIKNKFSEKIYNDFQKKLNEINQSYLEKKNNNISLTIKGRLYQNYVLRFFFYEN